MHDDDKPAEDRTPHTGPEPLDLPGEAGTLDVRALARDVSALVATVDQHSAEIDAIDFTLVVVAFALGALAGLVYLQAKELRALTG